MKNILLLLLIAATAISCSDDDNGKTNRPEPLSLPATVNVWNDQDVKTVYKFTYDEKHRIQNLVKSAGAANAIVAEINYRYNDKDLIESLDIVIDDDVQRCDFTYEDNDILKSLFFTNQSFPFAYNSATQQYTGAGFTIKLNDNGDLNTVNTIEINYLAEKKGILNSVGGKNIQLNNLLVDIISGQDFFLMLGSRSGIESFPDSGTNDTFDYTTTYNDAGYPTAITITNNLDAVLYKAEIEYTVH